MDASLHLCEAAQALIDDCNAKGLPPGQFFYVRPPGNRALVHLLEAINLYRESIATPTPESEA